MSVYFYPGGLANMSKSGGTPAQREEQEELPVAGIKRASSAAVAALINYTCSWFSFLETK